MILTFCVFLVLTTLRFDDIKYSSEDSPVLYDNKVITNQIVDHVKEMTALLEKLENNEQQRREQLRTTGIWVQWNSSKEGLPERFVTGGLDNFGWYGAVIRANYSGNLIPGKYNPDAHSAFVSYDGRENRIDDLTHNNYVWSEDVQNINTLIEGGYTNEQKTFICKVRHLKEWVSGKLVGSVCKVPYGGMEYVYNDWVALKLRN